MCRAGSRPMPRSARWAGVVTPPSAVGPVVVCTQVTIRGSPSSQVSVRCASWPIQALLLLRAWGLWVGDALVWPVTLVAVGATLIWYQSQRPKAPAGDVGARERRTVDLGPAARYRAFLAVSRGHVRLVLGTRAAMFAPVRDLGLVALWDDGNDAFAEPRAPYPHAREVAALRAALESAGLLLAGHARTAEVQALDLGLREVAMCPVRIALLHYAPTPATIAGEPEGIWAFLGSDRLAGPIAEHEPDLVLHGHAHAGTFSGAVGGVPVYNVSVPVMGRDFWVLEVDLDRRPRVSMH